MVKPQHLSKQTQQYIRVYNNIILQGQIINTKYTLQEQKKVNNFFTDTNNIQKIDVNK
jgi:hypothetical protein